MGLSLRCKLRLVLKLSSFCTGTLFFFFFFFFVEGSTPRQSSNHLHLHNFLQPIFDCGSLYTSAFNFEIVRCFTCSCRDAFGGNKQEMLRNLLRMLIEK